MAKRTLIVNTMPPGPTEDRMGEEGGILRPDNADPPDQPVSHTALQAPRRAVARRGVDPGTEKEPRRSSPTRLTADGYRIEGDDPSVVPWGYFEDDDL